MKAIVNIGLRTVTIEYSIDKKDQSNVPFEEREHNWETFQEKMSSKKIKCKQSFSFDDSDEWKSVQLLNGKIIDFHYDYENRSEFDSKKEWGSHIFQGYEYTEGEQQQYEENIVKSVKVEL